VNQFLRKCTARRGALSDTLGIYADPKFAVRSRLDIRSIVAVTLDDIKNTMEQTLEPPAMFYLPTQ
jgi:hypothetical protein